MNSPLKSSVRAYAFFVFTMGLMISVPMTYFNVFLTENLLMSAALMGTLVLVTRLIDFVVGLLAGGIMQRARENGTKYSSWLIAVRWIISIGIILIFTDTSTLPMTFRFLIAAIGYCMIHCSMNFVQTSYYNILAVLSGPSIEARNKLSFRGTQATVIAMIITSLMALPLIQWLSLIVGNSFGYLIVAIALAIPFLFGCSVLKKEANKTDTGKGGDGPKITVRDMIRSVTSNGQLLVVIVTWAIFYIGMFVANTIMAYYFIYVLGNFLYLTLALTISTTFGLISAVLGPKIGVKLGKKRAMITGMILAAIANVCIFFFARSSVAVYIVIMCLMSIATYFFTCFTVNYALDAGEYHLHKTGQDNRAVAVGMMNIPIKIGLALGGGIGGYGLSIIGYSTGMEVTPLFIAKFMVLFSIIPAILYVLAAILMLIGYRITDDDAARFAKENAERLKTAVTHAEE